MRSSITPFRAASIFSTRRRSIPFRPRPETQGSTERIVGSWLKARGGRDKVIVATKVSGRGEMTWLRENNAPTRLDKKNIAYAIEAR